MTIRIPQSRPEKDSSLMARKKHMKLLNASEGAPARNFSFQAVASARKEAFTTRFLPLPATMYFPTA